MILKLFHYFLYLLWKITGKKIIYTTSKENKTAVWSDFWFWYAGDVFNTSDMAYWIVQFWMVEIYSSYLLYNLVKILTIRKEKIVFFDVWANTGFFWILAQSIKQWAVQTHFFEPIKEFSDCIETSIYLNRFEWTSIVNTIWVSDKHWELTFHIQWTGTTADPEFIDDRESKQRIIKVTTLDSYSETHEAPDIIKIDVEGLEYQVLQWSKDLILEWQPILYVEIAQTLECIWRSYKNRHFRDIFMWLEWIGYKSFLVNQKGVREVENYKIFTIDWIQMYLFLHTINHKEIIAKINSNFTLKKIV